MQGINTVLSKVIPQVYSMSGMMAQHNPGHDVPCCTVMCMRRVKHCRLQVLPLSFFTLLDFLCLFHFTPFHNPSLQPERIRVNMVQRQVVLTEKNSVGWKRKEESKGKLVPLSWWKASIGSFWPSTL